MNVWGVVVLNCAVIAGFIALAWHFDRWWIALFAILLLFEWKGGNDG